MCFILFSILFLFMIVLHGVFFFTEDLAIWPEILFLHSVEFVLYLSTHVSSFLWAGVNPLQRLGAT